MIQISVDSCKSEIVTQTEKKIKELDEKMKSLVTENGPLPDFSEFALKN